MTFILFLCPPTITFYSQHNFTTGFHLQAGVEAPSLLFLLRRCGIEPHKAIIPQDNGRATWQIVEMCFLPLDQRWRELHEDALAQLMAEKRINEVQRAETTSYNLTFFFSIHMHDWPFHTLNCECGETALRQQRWTAPQPAKLRNELSKKERKKKRPVRSAIFITLMSSPSCRYSLIVSSSSADLLLWKTEQGKI